MPPRALIVDDEAPAREELRYLLQEIGPVAQGAPVQVVGEATNGEEALVLLGSLEYDLVLLDIRMPGLTGLEVARAITGLVHRPQVIFTTAYPDHAVDAFDLAAADYLVKPFDAERLRRAVERALSAGPERTGEDAASAEARRPGEGNGAAGREPPNLVRIPVQKDGRTVLVAGDAIVYAAAARGYASLKLPDERVLVSFSLNELERRLQGHFLRVHRSYLVNLRHVRELVPDFQGGLALVMNDRQRSRVEVSRRHARELRRRLGI
ncbi:LytR/AlgR family response regulator transcription factor [Georgenia satyanarayanai]|uniref:LytR/AlgR family response regulator transcription factor n=1 Tax=Georgenia satyanarayanai TaxID=860221 RepID=UPI000DA2038A|nr:LytTR family DNA-binding domain-containing protein [Georgenia satyanarayanai]